MVQVGRSGHANNLQGRGVRHGEKGPEEGSDKKCGLICTARTRRGDRDREEVQAQSGSEGSPAHRVQLVVERVLGVRTSVAEPVSVGVLGPE